MSTPRGGNSGYPQRNRRPSQPRSVHYDTSGDEGGWDNPELTPLDFSKTYGAAGAGRSNSNNSNSNNNKENQQQQQVEIDELKKENEMLREVEIQFWALLNEREELQDELNTVRAAGIAGGSPTSKQHAKIVQQPSLGAIGGDRTKELEADGAKLREESDQLHSALEECMELLMLKDRAETLDGGSTGSPNRTSMSANVLLRQHGPVSSFLAWLALENDRQNVRGALEGVLEGSKLSGANRPSGLTTVIGGSASPHRSPRGSHHQPGAAITSGISEEERHALHTELLTCKKEIKELQEELDRTDMSRLQALDDATRLQKQIEVLSSNVTELRGAYAQVKARADKSVEDTKVINQLKAQLADSVAECNEAKAVLAQQRQMQMVGATSLAADAARIRGELMSRERSRGRSEGGDSSVHGAGNSTTGLPSLSTLGH